MEEFSNILQRQAHASRSAPGDGCVRKRRGSMSEINVVPYIDVMLVLLVIFMVTAPLITPGQIDLPQRGQDARSRRWRRWRCSSAPTNRCSLARRAKRAVRPNGASTGAARRGREAQAEPDRRPGRW